MTIPFKSLKHSCITIALTTGEPPTQTSAPANLSSDSASNAKRKKLSMMLALVSLSICIGTIWYIRKTSRDLLREETLQLLLQSR